MLPDQKQKRTYAFAAFRYSNYRLFWVGNAFSNIGIWVLMAGRLWLMHLLTDSPLMLGLVAFCGLGPTLILSMWGGVVADRVNRMRLVTMTRAAFALTALLTGLLIVTEVIEPWHLLTISLVNGVLLSFDIPSRQAIIPNLVPAEHLMNAVVLQSLVSASATVLGPFLFAPLVFWLDVEGVFFFVAAMYVLTTIFFAIVDPTDHIARSKTSMPWNDLIEGFVYMWHQKTILSLVALGVIVGLFGSSLGTLLPIFAELLGEGVETYSNLLLSMGIGGFAVTVALAFWGRMKDSARLQLISGVSLGICLVVFALIDSLLIAAPIILLVGGFGSCLGIINNTLVQSMVSNEFRGRVMSVYMLGWGSSALGALLVGFLAQQINPRFALALAGVTLMVGSAVFTTLSMRTMGTEVALGPQSPTQ